MGTSIRTRLSFSHLLVLMIGMILAGILVWMTVEKIYLLTQEENLLTQARLTAAALDGSPVPSFSPEIYTQTTNVSPGIHTRLLNESGAVLIGVPFPEGENRVPVPASDDPGFVTAAVLLQRPEIQSALAGIPQTAVRKIAALDNKRVLYAAAPVIGENGSVTNLVYLATPLPSRGLPGTLTVQLLGAVLLAGLLAGVGGILLSDGIARPLERLDQAAAAVSNGDLTQRVPDQGRIRELERLGQTFNQMTESLHRSVQAKNAFIADATHELRNPLTVIKGTVETLEDGAVDDVKGRGKLLQSMKLETDRLIKLVNDLLILTRSDAKALSLEFQVFSLGKLVQTRCDSLEPLAIQQGVTFKQVSPPQDQTLVMGDPHRTAQVLDNIIDNALRFAPEKSVILLRLENQGNLVQCSVTDQGRGISSEHLSLIFERFYRVDPSRDRGSGGSGLGLAIARSLIEAQSGSIQAGSASGAGTTISFTLPAAELAGN